MNYFRCTVGGSGKGNTVTVTCAEEFAGLTITLAKTGKTYTKTCPSTSPYVVTFYGVENGTYTVSGTVDGQTYSETVIVQDISCVLNYGFTWRTWVDTASQLDSSDYESLDEVLADEKALRELFLEHACVDYMASVGASNEDLETVINNDLCAKWINLSDYALDFLGANTVIKALMDEADKYGYGEWALMPQVPTMTSNTAPYGEAFSDGDAAQRAPWHAFNHDGGSSAWWSNKSSGTAILGYNFENPIRVNRIFILYVEAFCTKDFRIEGSNDNFTSDINVLYIGENTVTTSGHVKATYDFENEEAYLSYRMVITSKHSGSYYGGIGDFQFYAWAPKGNVPVMTSATAPYGEASASTTLSTNYAYYAFNGELSTSSLWTSNATPASLTYKFTNPVDVRRFRIFLRGDSWNYQNPHEFIIKYSDDGTNYSSATGTLENSSSNYGKWVSFNVPSSGYHLYWQVYAINNFNSDSNISILSCQFYGRELKVSVPAMTSNTAPFGEAFDNPTIGGAYSAYTSFDGVDNNDKGWYGTASNQYVGYDFGKAVKITEAVIINNYNASRTYDCKVQATNTFSGEWTDVSSTVEMRTTNRIQAVTLTTQNLYRYYRLLITSVYNTYANVTELQFYGLDYSEKEFEEGTTKKWLYDHGVELEEFYMNGVGEKGSYYLKASKTTADATSTSACSTENVVDTTNYSLFRAKEGMNGYNSGSSNNGQISLGVVPVKGVMNGTTAIAIRDNVIADAPNNLYLDISNVNSSYYLAFGWGYKNALNFDLTELWLE